MPQGRLPRSGKAKWLYVISKDDSSSAGSLLAQHRGREEGLSVNNLLCFLHAEGWGSAVLVPRDLLSEYAGQICPPCLSLGLFQNSEM